MPRIFVYDGREFDDPDPDKTPEEVRLYLTHFYGDLGNATTVQRTEGEKQIYEFRKRIGTKGYDQPAAA